MNAAAIAVVVKAQFGSKTMESDDAWQVRKGDLGTLKWKSHRGHPRYLEPCVVWDGDPQRKSRRVILASISIVGLQTPAARVLLFPISK